MAKLTIENLHVSIKGTEILKGVNLSVNAGETVALLGPNGHGKSTLFSTIMGHPLYEVTAGRILLDDLDVLSLSPDERSKAGFFLGMQYPAEIPGLNSADFYKAAMNAHREKPLALFQFYRELEKAYQEMGIPLSLSQRNLNEGFSGGEKKRNEILQMRLLSPKFAMLDEVDSGLDVDAINLVANAIIAEQKRGTSFLLISHYARLLDLVEPSRSAVLVNGRIVAEGGPELFKRIDKEGYEWIKRDLGISIEKEDAFEANKVSLGACATKLGTKS